MGWAEAGAAIETNYGYDRCRNFGGNRWASQRSMIGVARDVAVRGNFIAMQAHGEGAPQVGGQAGHFERGRGGTFGRESVLGQGSNYLGDVGVRGAKTRHELVRVVRN